jgi:hypothetical protein
MLTRGKRWRSSCTAVGSCSRCVMRRSERGRSVFSKPTLESDECLTSGSQFAFESYIECVRTFPYGPAPVPRIDFNALPSTKHLGSIVEKLTHLGTHELLLGADQVSLKPRLVSAGLEPGVVGGLLEKQLDALEPHLWKEGVREVVKAILVHALEVYQGEMPVRRARVLTRCLEFLYYVGPDSVPTSGWHPEDMGTESARILQCDVRLSPFPNPTQLRQACD